MTLDINFSNIRDYDNSKQNGFEELVCQIAHIEKPVNGKQFIRKEGAGGDAGVECFWKLEDGSEYAWQAKYFMESFKSSQWSEIDISVKAALEKHKQLKRYYICVPRDRTDSRKKGVNGRNVKTDLTAWNDYVQKWTELADKNGMNVEFIYWGKHEISQYLQQDKPEYVGKILYWFDAAAISSLSLKELADNSKKCLGERYNAEHNIELPIAKTLSCIGKDNDWKNSIKNLLSDVYDLRGKIIDIVNDKMFVDIKEKCEELKNHYETFLSKTFEFEKDDNILFENLEWYKEISEELYNQCDYINTYIYDKYESKDITGKIYDEERYKIRKTFEILEKVIKFFNDVQVKAGKEKKLLITGEAGTGKSHLLCDVALKRLENNLPTVFLLGQHYSGGNPVRFIAQKLNLLNYTDEEILGALDSKGESYKCRLLIIIDAVNEGNYKKDWQDFLQAFLLQCDRYRNLAVVISCRTTYIDYILPKEVLSIIPKINHKGFKGFENRAARVYLRSQGIVLPSAPFFSSEFTNPLFLKTACKAIKDMGLKEFPKGLKGFNKVFEFYLNNIERIVKNEKNIHRNNTVHKAIKEYIEAIYPDKLSGLPYDDAEEIFNKYDCSFGTKSLFDILLFEGVLSLDVCTNEYNEQIEVVRFTYERFCDYAIAQHILEACNNEAELGKLFEEDNIIFNLIKNGNKYQNRGIIEALGIEIPEKFKKEFLEFTNNIEECDSNWFLETTFQNGILSRTADTITDKSLELLNRLQGYSYHANSLDILVALSTEPRHPWNSEFLDSNLRRKKLADRDAFWSTYVAINDYKEDEETPESPIRTLLNWVLDGDIHEAEEERLRLTGIILLWLTTTSNRMLRQEATKAFAKVLYYIPDKIKDFIEKFNDIDDDYLVTSLYGGAYGAIVNINEPQIIKQVAEEVIQKQLDCKIEYPNILIRDYARGIVEYAHVKGIINVDIERYRPPYKSKWPLEKILPSEIDKICGSDYEIKNSVQGFIGDFGKYVMNTVGDWTATSITNKRPKNLEDLKYEFAETLSGDMKEKYLKVLDEEREEINNEKDFDLEELLNSYSKIQSLEDEDNDIQENEESTLQQKKHDGIIDEIKSKLDEEKLIKFNSLCRGGRNDMVVPFDHEFACRWVIKRAYQLGWDSKLFEYFERTYCSSYGRINENIIERIGKKYEWIAYYELLARLSDNLLFNNRGYCDVDDSKFYGAWQIDIREMDPSFWFKGKTDDTNYDDTKNRWWRPYQFILNIDDLQEQIKWLWNTRDLPDFKNIICLEDNDSNKWLNLTTFCDWTMKAIKNKKILGEPNLWYRINTLIIRKKDFETAKNNIINKSLCSPDIINVPDSRSQMFLGEYPWHPCYDDLRDWVGQEEWEELKFSCKYHVPVYEYEWSTGMFSHVRSEHNNFHMPSKKLINDMHLYKDISNPSNWYKDSSLVFVDPVFKHDTQPCALIKRNVMCQWLRDNDYVLLWLIGGEKQLFTRESDKFYGRLVYSSLYYMDGSGIIDGSLWTGEEHPIRGN